MKKWHTQRLREFNQINLTQPAICWRYADWLLRREYTTGYGIGLQQKRPRCYESVFMGGLNYKLKELTA